MCLIVDASMFKKFPDRQDRDMAHLPEWLREGGRLVYTHSGKFGEEMRDSTKMMHEYSAYRRAKRTREITAKDYTAALKQLHHLPLRSNDQHVLALAIASNTRLLCSDDKRLHKDFKNRNIIRGGQIYQYASHRHLLEETVCR